MQEHAEQEMCPFCPLYLPGSPESWLPVDVSASIGGVRSCNCCAVATLVGDNAQEMLDALQERQKESSDDK